MKADVAHAFWHGKVNLMTALEKRISFSRARCPKILKLLPAVEPLYKVYPVLLQRKGYGDMVLK